MNEFLRRHMVCWYSPRLQGATRESLAADPRLADLSGRSRDLALTGFDWTQEAVVTTDGGLQFQGGEACGTCESGFVLTDFTLIYNRGALWFHTLTNPGHAVCSKGNALIVEDTTFARAYANYAFTEKRLTADRATHSWNMAGCYAVTPEKIMRIGDDSSVQMHRGYWQDSASNKLRISIDYRFVLYDFMLFDRALNDGQIQWAADNMIIQ